MGIVFALASLFSWGFGDFFIQKSSRALSIWKTLFFISFAGGVVLFPFVWREIGLFLFDGRTALLFFIATVVTTFAALFDFEALKEGKIAIVEPIFGLELLVTLGLSIGVWGEILSGKQVIIIALIFIGIMSAATIHYSHLRYHRRIFERGVVCAGLAAIGMGLVNFLLGVLSQMTSPLFSIWVTHSLIALICFFYLLLRGEFSNIINDFQQHARIILSMSLFDNAAWIFYAFAVRHIPISIAITLSESYIALAVLLGFFVNRERLRAHQIIGVVVTVIGIIALSSITSG